nr:LpqN/LpqT family lipoprotein [Mycolicibacterium palauense]
MTTVTAAGIATLALGLGIVGCGSDSTTDETTTSTTTSAEETTTGAAETTSAQAAPSPAPRSNETIPDYLKANDISETAMHHGDPGPTIDLPVPEGWRLLEEGPQAPYGGIVYTSPTISSDPPTVVAIFSKLTGDVDPAKILELAPNELTNLPGYEPLGPTNKSDLDGFEAVQLGGAYTRDGKKRLIAQKTVVIPAPDGIFVLQLNADGPEVDAGALMQATGVIDDQTKITM